MKININKVKQIPKSVTGNFGVCVFGQPDKDVAAWITEHGFKTENVGPYTNIYIDKNIDDVFESAYVFEYVDGFSPNLNKHLHLGHMSNLVLAKAFVGMGVAKKTVAILGDTLEGEVSTSEALDKFKWYCDTFDYKIDEQYLASEMSLDDTQLEDGADEYTGTAVFSVGDAKLVGKKSDGSTSYFYQDVALASKLNAPTLYITGQEQNGHFASLKKLFPTMTHIGTGLVKTGQQKMSSRVGNVIFADDLLKLVMDCFDGNLSVAYNVIAGHILKSTPKTDKNIDLFTISNPINSLGLYLSYTLAKLKSAGVHVEHTETFVSKELQFKLLKAQQMLSPNVLFEGLVDLAKLISGLYVSHTIKDNAGNKEMFSVLAADLLLGMTTLGMLDVDHV